MKFKLLNDRVLVRPIEVEEKTSGGIILPETVRDVPVFGEVIATGPGVFQYQRFIPTTVKPGDVVMFHRNAGTLVEIDGETLIMLYEREIYLIVQDEGNEDAGE